MSAAADGERGSLSIEYVIVAPLFLIVFGLIFAFFREGQLNGLLDAGARDAARAVSISPSLSGGAVHQVALNSVQDELRGGAGGCTSTSKDLHVYVTSYDPDHPDVMTAQDGEDLKPGQVALVTVTCKYSLSDLGIPIPGLSGLQAGAQFASIIDPNRSTREKTK